MHKISQDGALDEDRAGITKQVYTGVWRLLIAIDTHLCKYYSRKTASISSAAILHTPNNTTNTKIEA
jgi:hypothetical protein